MAGGIHLRLPYQSDPETRKRINAGEMEYMDIHLSHVAQFVEYGFLGKLDLALIEVTAVLEDGRLVPSSSLGNNKTWIEQAEHVIIEVNSWQPAALEGMQKFDLGGLEVSYSPTDHTGLDFADLSIISADGRFRR